MKWISVSEELPKPGERILCYTRERGFGGWFEGYYKSRYFPEGFCSIEVGAVIDVCRHYGVTHWMRIEQPNEMNT